MTELAVEGLDLEDEDDTAADLASQNETISGGTEDDFELDADAAAADDMLIEHIIDQVERTMSLSPAEQRLGRHAVTKAGAIA